MAAQDPRERFDLCDAEGRLLGRTKARAAVHRDGDWHRSLHLWLLLTGPPATEGAPWLVLQRRSAAKDTFPGAVDVAVTGHLGAGETLAAALRREAREELGLPVRLDRVRDLGRRRRPLDDGAGLRDNELQAILLTSSARPLAALRPHPEELEALLALPLGAARALCAGRRRRAPALALRPGEAAPRPVELALDEWVPAPDGYYRRALAQAAALAAGRSRAPLLR